MKKKLFVLITWKRMKQAEVAGFVFNTVTMMTDNKYFAEPAVPMPDMSKAASLYAEKYGNRKNGGNGKADFLNAKKALFALLDTQAKYVTIEAQNADKEDIITSSGFVSSKSSNSRSVVPVQPKNPVVSYKNGELILSLKKVKEANSYCWVIFLGTAFPIIVSDNVLNIDPKAKFMMIPAGNLRETVRGIGVGQDLYVQVLAQNTAGKSSFTLPVFVHTGTN